MALTDPWLPASPNTAAWSAIPLKVYRYNSALTGSAGYTLLANVACVGLERRQGGDPGSAMLRYIWDTGDAQAPNSIEQALDTASTLTKVIEPDDRIVVRATRPDGTDVPVFDGVPVLFGCDLDAGHESVDIVCVGIAHRLKDEPIAGALMRRPDQMTTTTAGAQVPTDLVARCNPRGEPNAIDDTHRATTPTGSPVAEEFPVFVETGLIDQSHIVPWTLSRIARYIVFYHNAAATYVVNPTGTALDAMLVARKPITGTVLDQANAATYTAERIVVPDKPLTGKDWPGTLHDLIAQYGFGMSFALAYAAGGGVQQTRTTLKLYHQQAGAVKDVFLQTRGSNLDLTLSNVGRVSLRRNIHEVVNAWQVDGHLKRWEASFVLAPAFSMATADCASIAAMAVYDKSNAAFTTGNNSNKYREYIFDEAKEGTYTYGTATTHTPYADSGILGISALIDQAAAGDYLARLRRPIGELFSTDDNGTPLRATLQYCTSGYQTSYPALWDGTGTWTPISGGWRLLKDRIGIYVDVENPNNWTVGEGPFGNPTVLKGVEAIANPNANNPSFRLMLTVVIEADHNVQGLADDLTDQTPIADVITRRVDARDRYFLDTIFFNSAFNDTGSDVVVRDDTDDATAEALAVRTATEAGVLEGEVEVPYMTFYYEVGDRIRSISGRNLGLRTDAGGVSSSAVYPVVIAVRHVNDGDQQRTILTLSDAGLERTGHRREMRIKDARA